VHTVLHTYCYNPSRVFHLLVARFSFLFLLVFFTDSQPSSGAEMSAAQDTFGYQGQPIFIHLGEIIHSIAHFVPRLTFMASGQFRQVEFFTIYSPLSGPRRLSSFLYTCIQKGDGLEIFHRSLASRRRR
jgi:hypothetical protein